MQNREAILEALLSLKEATERSFSEVFRRLDKIDGRLDGNDGRLDKIDGRLDALETRFDRFERKVMERFDLVDLRLAAVER